jgi:hypothetical protein
MIDHIQIRQKDHAYMVTTQKQLRLYLVAVHVLTAIKHSEMARLIIIGIIKDN